LVWPPLRNPLPVTPPGADRDDRLVQLVTDRGGDRARVGEGGEPLLLVGLEQVQLEGCRAANDADQDQSGNPPGRRTGDSYFDLKKSPRT
jgi:hypothetical protein